MRRVVLASVIGVTLLVASKALAAPPKLELSPVFGKALLEGQWQPVAVTVTNPNEGAAFQGQLSLEVRDEDRNSGWPTVTYVQPLTLPVGKGVAQARFLIQSPSSRPHFTLRLSNTAGQVVQTAEEVLPVAPGGLNLLAVGTPKPLPLANTTLMVRRSGNTLHLAHPPKEARNTAGAPMDGMGMGSPDMPERVWATYTSPTLLGAQARDYAAFGMVYFGPEAPWERLTELQQKALLRYVRQGGVLVKYAKDERVEHLGLGTIVETDQVDTPKDWTGIARAGVMEGSVLENQSWELGDQVLQGGVEAPPFSTLALFLGVYLLVVVPGQYLILRRLDKREWAWVTTPLLACGFAVAAYQFGSLGRSQDATYNLASTIELTAGSGEGTAYLGVGVYSPKRASYTLAIPSAETFFDMPASYRHAQTNTVDLGTSGREMLLKNFAIPQWSIRGVLVGAEVTLGEGVILEAKRQGDRLVGRVVNNTGHTLEQVTLFARGHRSLLGSLAAGERRTLDLVSVQEASLSRSGMPVFTVSGDPDLLLLQANISDSVIPVQLDGKPGKARDVKNTLYVRARVAP